MMWYCRDNSIVSDICNKSNNAVLQVICEYRIYARVCRGSEILTNLRENRF